jgi:CheY-like chemotaxis protein
MNPNMAQQSLRILVLDDEEAVRGVLKMALERSGYELDTVSSGTEALKILSNTSYDLILCDMHMPGLSGPDFYRQLERNHPAMTDRIIFMTGDLVHSGTQRFLDETKVSVLRKPFDLRQLYQKIDAIIQRDNQ